MARRTATQARGECDTCGGEGWVYDFAALGPGWAEYRPEDAPRVECDGPGPHVDKAAMDLWDDMMRSLRAQGGEDVTRG